MISVCHLLVALELIARGTGPGIEVREQPGEPTALGRALDRLPAKLIVYAIEGQAFTTGSKPM